MYLFQNILIRMVCSINIHKTSGDSFFDISNCTYTWVNYRYLLNFSDQLFHLIWKQLVCNANEPFFELLLCEIKVKNGFDLSKPINIFKINDEAYFSDGSFWILYLFEVEHPVFVRICFLFKVFCDNVCTTKDSHTWKNRIFFLIKLFRVIIQDIFL